MDVTVVLPTVGGKWLPEQLEALSTQSCPPVQVVLVNNGRPGVVDDVVGRWSTRIPQLELVEDRTHAMAGFARNVGAEHARAPGLLFLDDDDVVDKGYVAAMSAALDRSELVAARVDLDRLNPPSLTRRWGRMQADGLMSHHGFLPWSVSAGLGVRRETFDRLGGFDITLPICEDTDFSWRAQLDAKARITFVPEAQVAYRLRSGLRSAFRQARTWGVWEVELHRRYRDRGLPSRGSQLRALRRWARPVLLVARARRSDDLVIAARQLGGCVGRLEGSVRYRLLDL